MPDSSLLVPRWPAPASVRAVSTTRAGGVSRGPWEGLNLATHVGDEHRLVEQNRALLAELAGLPAQPLWLRQVHGCRVVDPGSGDSDCEGDAQAAGRTGLVCAVMTADCLPLLLCNRAGSRVAAVHAGWRGMAAGVIERALAGFVDPADQLMAWLGPAIGPRAFEVGGDVRQAFLASDPAAAEGFRQTGPATWLANLYWLARRRLQACGVLRVYGAEWCTYSDPRRFYSYRRDGATGRMASLIWIAD